MTTINGGRAMSSPVVRSRNVLNRNSMRFAAAFLAALASLVAGPNATLDAAPQTTGELIALPPLIAVIPLVLLKYCSFYLHNSNQKKSMRLFPDVTHEIGQGYFCERSFEAVLSLRKHPRHASLEVAADRTPLVDRIEVNRERRWRRTGTVYVQQRDLSRRTRKHARSALAAFCHDQARFRELGERLSNEGGVGVHTVGQGRRGNFLAVEVTQGSHDVRGNRKLDAFH